MRRWYDADTKRTYVLIEAESELTRYATYMDWTQITEQHQCSRATAMRCLRQLEFMERARLSDGWILYFLIRVPGQKARTVRKAAAVAVSKWFSSRRSVGNPNFVDSGYQSALASRPRGTK